MANRIDAEIVPDTSDDAYRHFCHHLGMARSVGIDVLVFGKDRNVTQ